MKFARPLAASGVAVAAVVATLGAVAPAQAAVATANYNCTSPVGIVPFSVSVDATAPPTAPAGAPIDKGLLQAKSTATTSNATAAGMLKGLGYNGAKVKDFSATIGGTKVLVPATFTTDAVDPAIFHGTGANEAFVLPVAGAYVVALPAAFTITPTKNGVEDTMTLACTVVGTPGNLGSITLSKQVSKTTAKAPKKAVSKKKAAITVAVSNEYVGRGGAKAGGSVVAKVGKKVVGRGTVSNGTAVVKLKKLKKGVNKVTVSYLGDGYDQPSKAAKVVKVKVK